VPCDVPKPGCTMLPLNRNLRSSGMGTGEVNGTMLDNPEGRFEGVTHELPLLLWREAQRAIPF
jgi:hypothetical protein